MALQDFCSVLKTAAIYDTIPSKAVKRMSDMLCEECENFDYDEECEDYVCVVDLDMDEYERLVQSGHRRCPYYRVRDDYRIVRKQN